MKTEIDKHISQVSKEIKELETTLSIKEKCIDTLRTPYEVCKEYLHLINGPLSNKERKKRLANAFRKLKEEHRFISNDTDTITQINATRQELEDKKVLLLGVKDYASQQVRAILSVLEERGFIQYVDDRHIVTTKVFLPRISKKYPGTYSAN